MSATRTNTIIAELTADAGTQSLPERLCAACADALPVSGVGLVFINDTGPVGIVAATDGAARRMEDLQLTLGEGPCVEAAQTRRPVLQPDLPRTAVSRWPHYGPAVLEAGIAAIFAFPLQVGLVRLGVLDLYRDSPGMLDADELDEALAFTDAATEIMLRLQSSSGGEGLHPQLSGGAAYSPVIAQSTGMIAAQAGVGVGEALLMLRARAYASDRKVLQLAHDVVDRRLRFDPEEVLHA
jgi:GAF domain